MGDRFPAKWFSIGLVVSVLLHLTLLLPAMIAVMRAQGLHGTMLRARFEPEAFRRPETEPPEELLELGIEESDASTMTWIGYEDYQEHLAQLAEIEQAAFTDAPPGAVPSEAAPADAMAEAQQPDPLESPDPQAQRQESVEAAEAAASTSPDPFEEALTWLETAARDEGPPQGAATDPAARHRALFDAIERIEDMQREPQQVAERPQQQAPRPAGQGPSPQQPAGEPGDVADQESDPTSIVDVKLEDIMLGRPLAAHGLRLRPRKPHFTSLMMVTSLPADPRAELRFRRDGKPLHCRLLESSGDGRIDEAILNSLYRWRASGEKLRELSGGQTIPIRIRIVLK